MNFKNFDPGNNNLGVKEGYNYFNTQINNNAFLLLSSHRNEYFYKYDEMLNCKNDSYEGYHLDKLFFSNKNIIIIQRKLVLEVYNRTMKKYLIPYQNKNSLITLMKYVFNEQAQHLPYDNTGQIRILNQKVVDEIYPMIINNLDFRDHYINEISSERKINSLPVNTSNRRNNSLPATTNTFFE